MSENVITNWINDDQDLNNLLVDIQLSARSKKLQAEKAFDKICQLYALPKMPQDLDEYLKSVDETLGEIRSVYEEFAILKYLNPSTDIRALVMSAAFNVKNFYAANIQDVINIMIKAGENPKFIGIVGNKLDTEIICIENFEKGFAANCLTVYKVIDTAGNSG